MSSKTPLTIFTGQRSQARLVSRSWGVARPSLVQGLDWTPNISSQVVMEFDNLAPALQYTTFDDVTGKLTYQQNNQMNVEAVLMDQDQTQDELMVNPANLVPFVAFANLKGSDGRIKGSYLLRGCTPTGNPFTSTVKEGAQRTLDFKALNAYYFHGLAIAYTRFRGENTIQDPPDTPTLAVALTGGSLAAGTYYVQITAVTAAGETIASNEATLEITEVDANNAITVTIPTITAPVTAYNVYVSTLSNGELYFGQATVAGAYTITEMPAATAARPPLTNTSGIPAVEGDKVLTLDTGVYEGSLDNAAFKLPQTGLDYVLILKNGSEIANVDNPATAGGFGFNAAGDEFRVLDAGTPDDWYDVFTLYKPNPA